MLINKFTTAVLHQWLQRAVKNEQKQLSIGIDIARNSFTFRCAWASTLSTKMTYTKLSSWAITIDTLRASIYLICSLLFTQLILYTQLLYKDIKLGKLAVLIFRSHSIHNSFHMWLATGLLSVLFFLCLKSFFSWPYSADLYQIGYVIILWVAKT